MAWHEMSHAGRLKSLALVLLSVRCGAGQGLSDIAALVRQDAQRLATDVHVALGLEARPLPPIPITPPPVVPITTEAPSTSTPWPNATATPYWSTNAPLTTDWPATTVLPDTSLPPPSTTAALTPTTQPPVSSSTMAQSTSSAPVSSSTAQPTTSAVPTPPSSSTAQPTTTAAPMPSTTVAVPTTTAAPTTTGAVTTSSAPTTTVMTTAAPGTCTNPQVLVFSGTSGDDVGVQGPFNFTGWTYDAVADSTPPAYNQAIFNTQDNTQDIGVVWPYGILLCGIAASGKGASTPATFNGYTMVNTIVTTNATLDAYTDFADVAMDTTWQPLQSISIVTIGDPSYCTTELWRISYQVLGMAPG